MISLNYTPVKASSSEWKQIRNEVSRAILHDFNNWIGSICAVSDFYARNTSPEEDLKNAFEDIKKESLKIHKLMQKVFQIFMKDDKDTKFFDIQQVLEELRPIIRAIIPKYCGFTIDIIQTLDHGISTSQIRFEKILLSILVNISKELKPGSDVCIILDNQELKIIVELEDEVLSCTKMTL